MRHLLFPAVILIAFFIAACNPPSNNTSGEPPEDPENSQAAGGDADDDLPEGWVEGIPLHPDFDITDMQGDGDTMVALLLGYKPIPRMVEFYEDVEGWERDLTRGENPRVEYRTLYFTKGEKEMMILIGRNEIGTVVDIEIYYPDQREEDADPE
jgi:hypothetical protein